MNRFFKILFVLLVCISVKVVYAENYKIKELIPYNVKTSIHTDNFSYKGFYFDNSGIHFDGIKNLSAEQLPITISVGLFNKDGKNIGTINYCNLQLKSKEEIGYVIEFEEYYLGDGEKKENIKYISILSDNIYCRTSGSKDYLGQSVDELGVSHKGEFNKETDVFFSILTVLAALLVVYIVYKLLFAKSFQNIDNKYIREAYEVPKKQKVAKPQKNKKDDKIEILEEDKKTPKKKHIKEEKTEEVEILEEEKKTSRKKNIKEEVEILEEKPKEKFVFEDAVKYAKLEEIKKDDNFEKFVFEAIEEDKEAEVLDDENTDLHNLYK